MEYTYLGRTDIKVSRIGIGTWQWGSKSWGYGVDYSFEDILDAFNYLYDKGFNFIDTAEMYGGGESERIIGEITKEIRESIVIASKVWPTHLSYKGVIKAFQKSAERLQTDYIDLYYVHWPNPIKRMKSYAPAFLELYNSGKIRAIGVSNFSLKKMVKFDELVEGNLAANQVRYSLLYRKVEKDLLSYCIENNISLVAYSSLDQGAITGKYDEKNLPKDIWRRISSIFTPVTMRRIKPLIDKLGEIAENHGVKRVNVALRYLISKGAIPLVGIKNRAQAEDLALTFDFKLRESEIKELEEILSSIKIPKVRALPSIFKRVIFG